VRGVDKMKVALCVPEYNSALNETCVPYGLASIAGYLREQVPSVEVKIFDGMAKHDVHARLLEFQPEVIGVTASTPQALDAYKLLHWCKTALKNPLTVIGGVHASALPEEAKEHADVVVVGEGELAFTEIIKDLMNGIRAKGIIQGEYIQDLDSLPPTPFDLVDVKEYLAHGPWLPGLESPVMNGVSSRGCPYNCCFCKNSTRKDPVRYHGAKRIVDEILYIHNRFGVTSFYFSDDEFLLNVKRLREIAELFKHYGMLEWIRWACQARTKNTTLETLKLAKSMGCVTIAFGLESGCQKSLEYWKTGTTSVEDNMRALRFSKMVGIIGGGSFIFGGPHETLEDMQEGLEWILNNDVLFFAGVGTLIPFPGTSVWNYCKKIGSLPKNVDYKRLVPTSFAERTYFVNSHMPLVVYRRFLVHATRLMRIYCDARLSKGFFGLSRSLRWWWGWAFHPLYMLKLVKQVITLKE